MTSSQASSVVGQAKENIAPNSNLVMLDQTKAGGVTLDSLRLSILSRDARKNGCMNQQCLDTECRLLEAHKATQRLKDELNKMTLTFLEQEGVISELKEQLAAKEKQLLKASERPTNKESAIQTD